MVATPYASGFDHFLIADEAQFKFDRCIRLLQEEVSFGYQPPPSPLPFFSSTFSNNHRAGT